MSFIDQTRYFLQSRNTYTFSGGDVNCNITYSKTGVTWLQGFRLYDERGKRDIETRHPETLLRLIKTKASLTFQIKQWAEGRADDTLPLDLFSKRIAREQGNNWLTDTIDIETELSLPEWVVNAVETQKFKYGIYATTIKNERA